MKKSIILLGTLLVSGLAFSQVGLNTPTPKATLDVVGKATDNTSLDGVIVPRMTGDQLRAKTYTTEQTGAVIYATSAPSILDGQVINVTKAALYIFDGKVWGAGPQGPAGTPGTDGLPGTPGPSIHYVLNATTNGGLLRTGAGTNASEYSLGLTPGTTNGQVMTWNGTTWSPANALNIYNADGTLTTNRTVALGGRQLTFKGTSQETVWGSSGMLTQYGTISNANIILNAADGNGNGISGRLVLQIYPERSAQIIADSDATGLSLGTNQTTVSAPISFDTSSGNGANGAQRAEISGDGRFNIVNTLSVGYSGQQTFTGTQKLKVNGSIVTAGATYADYVFEDYYNKSSVIKPAYKFSSLYDTEKFIKENKHLPGVTSIKELEKTTEGYFFNISDLSVQSLEKIEELYLHTIEQQKQIDEQKSQITLLLSITEKLKSEVELLKKQ